MLVLEVKMKITIISVGKIREKYFCDAIEEYLKRMQKYCQIERLTLTDEKILESIPDLVIKEKEGQKIIKSLNPDSFKIVLTEKGKSYSSEKLANFLEEKKDNGFSHLTFIIGGALGLSESVLAKSDFIFSLSALTMPHQMAYLFLVEQLYRCFKIINNEPYHK